MRIFVFIAILLLLGGCSSQSATIQYYLLYSPEDTRHQSLEDSKSVRLAKLTVPDYLKQRGMPVMTEANQVHISKSHMWAESFEPSLNKLLGFAVEPDFFLVSSAADNPSNIELEIDILHLIPSEQGDVILSARYLVRHDGKVVSNQAYAKKYPLLQNGYAHTVDRYRHAIFEFSNEVAKQLRKL